MTPMTDDEVTSAIAIILRAYDRKFPQLKGRGGPQTPIDRDMATAMFAKALAEHLRLSNIHCHQGPPPAPDRGWAS